MIQLKGMVAGAPVELRGVVPACGGESRAKFVRAEVCCWLVGECHLAHMIECMAGGSRVWCLHGLESMATGLQNVLRDGLS